MARTGVVDRARAGDRGAFGELYAAHQALVHRFIHRRTGDHALAEDLTSETFLRALGAIGRFTWQGSDFEAWLVTIARNLVTDHYKSARTNRETPVGDMYDQDHAVASTEDQVVNDLTRSDDAHALQQAMAVLTGPQQEILHLRYWGELPFTDITQRTGRTLPSVKMLKTRAVLRLRRNLTDPATPATTAGGLSEQRGRAA
jgi:RNA polymerase sigma-70 factor (ECF subfamily)